MIIWSGKGWLTVFIILFGIIITQGVYETFTGLKSAEQDHDLMWAVSFLLAAIGNFAFARWLAKQPNRIVIDKETGEEFALEEDSTLFFIGVSKWSWIFVAVSGHFWLRFFLDWD